LAIITSTPGPTAKPPSLSSLEKKVLPLAV